MYEFEIRRGNKVDIRYSDQMNSGLNAILSEFGQMRAGEHSISMRWLEVDPRKRMLEKLNNLPVGQIVKSADDNLPQLAAVKISNHRWTISGHSHLFSVDEMIRHAANWKKVK